MVTPGQKPKEQTLLGMLDCPKQGAAARWALVLAAAGAGLLQLVLSEVSWFFAVAVAVASTLGVVGIAVCSLRPRGITPADMLAAALSMGYGLGTANTLVRSWIDGIDPLAQAYASPRSLAETLGNVLLVVAALLVVGGLEKTRLMAFSHVPPARHRPIAWLAGLFVLMAFVMLATGQIGYQMNLSIEGGGGRISPTAATVIGALTPMAALAAHCAFSAQRRYRVAFVVIVCATLVVMVTQGRRLFLFSLLLCVMGYFSAGAKLPTLSLRSMIAVGAGVVAVQLAAKVFFAMRLASYDYSTMPSLGELLSGAWEILVAGDKVGLQEQLSENLRDRTFVLEYLAELLDKVKTHSPMYGEVLLMGLAFVIPSVFWSGKDRFIALGAEESIVHPHLGMPDWDAANTILTSGVSDFGMWGLFAYPIACALLFSLVVRLATRMDAAVRGVLGFSLAFSLLNVEATLSGPLVGLRSAVITGMLVYFAVVVVDRFGRASRDTQAQGPL